MTDLEQDPIPTLEGVDTPAEDHAYGMYFASVKRQIEQWADDRKILSNSVAQQQLKGKMFEEVQETIDALNEGDPDKIHDGFGDIGVVWLIACKQAGEDPLHALQDALKVILPRKGYLDENGVFVKDE